MPAYLRHGAGSECACIKCSAMEVQNSSLYFELSESETSDGDPPIQKRMSSECEIHGDFRLSLEFEFLKSTNTFQMV
jgi:hypothetical protein